MFRRLNNLNKYKLAGCSSTISKAGNNILYIRYLVREFRQIFQGNFQNCQLTAGNFDSLEKFNGILAPAAGFLFLLP
jgi:hypothetical protein